LVPARRTNTAAASLSHHQISILTHFLKQSHIHAFNKIQTNRNWYDIYNFYTLDLGLATV